MPDGKCVLCGFAWPLTRGVSKALRTGLVERRVNGHVRLRGKCVAEYAGTDHCWLNFSRMNPAGGKPMMYGARKVLSI